MKTTVVNVRVEKCDIFVGRPTKWGNPFHMRNEEDRPRVIAQFRRHIERRPDLIAAARKELRGKRLGCFCAPAACHADVLAEIADS